MITILQILKNEPSRYKDAEELSHGNGQQDYQNLSSCETQNTVVIN